MVKQSLAIVIKSQKYGDTSLICHLFTRTYGLQMFMIKGVRSAKSKSINANLFQVGNVLDIQMYYNPSKNFQILKECNPVYVYNNLRENIQRNCVQTFAIEVLTQIVIAAEPQEDVFDFTFDFFKVLEEETSIPSIYLPSYFVTQMNQLSGYNINGQFSELTPFFNFVSGTFTTSQPQFPPFIEGATALILSRINSVTSIHELTQIPNIPERKLILQALLLFMEYHYPDFKPLKSLPVLSIILS